MPQKYLFWPCTDLKTVLPIFGKLNKILKTVFSNLIFVDCSLMYKEGLLKFAYKK